MIGKTIASLWSKKFKRSGTNGDNIGGSIGDNIGPRIWEFTKLRQRRKVIENERGCFDKTMVSKRIVDMDGS